MINTEIRLAILAYGKECSKKNEATASLVGKFAGKHGISLVAGNVTSTFGFAFEQAKNYPVSTICVIEKHKKPTSPHLASEVILTKDTYSKHDQIAQMSDAAILIGGGAGSQLLLNHFIKSHKTVIAIIGSGGLADNDLPKSVYKARNITEAFKILKSTKKESYLNTDYGLLKLTFNHFALTQAKFLEEAIKKEDSNNEYYLTQFKEYFKGKSKEFTGKVYLEGTEFQQRTWKALLDIPYGKTMEYGALASLLGDKKTSGAVGYAAEHNPIWIIIPCHRLLGRGGGFTTYAGGLELQTRLLNLEKHQTELGLF